MGGEAKAVLVSMVERAGLEGPALSADVEGMVEQEARAISPNKRIYGAKSTNYSDSYYFLFLKQLKNMKKRIKLHNYKTKILGLSFICAILFNAFSPNYSYALFEFLSHLKGSCSVNYKYGNTQYTECTIDSHGRVGTITTLDGQQHALFFKGQNETYFDGELSNSTKPRCVGNSVMEICFYDK